MSIGEQGNVGMKKTESINWEYEKSGHAKLPKFNLPDGIRSRKGGKENREKYSPGKFSWRSHAVDKKIAKFQKVSAEFVLFLPIEKWVCVHGQGMYTYTRAGVTMVFSKSSTPS